MQMCLFYKQPTLAVKTLLHMKLYKIELTPITYSVIKKISNINAYDILVLCV